MIADFYKKCIKNLRQRNSALCRKFPTYQPFVHRDAHVFDRRHHVGQGVSRRHEEEESDVLLGLFREFGCVHQGYGAAEGMSHEENVAFRTCDFRNCLYDTRHVIGCYFVHAVIPVLVIVNCQVHVLF